METKQCRRCGETKPVDQFYANARYVGGRVHQCAACLKQSSKANYAARVADRPVVVREIKEAWAVRNADKMKEYRRNWYEKNGERHKGMRRNNRYVALYGITTERYEEMLAEQGGRCAACGSTETGWKWDVFHVDHDHKTGKVRALLCAGCNVALGAVDDDASRMLALVEYLRRHGEAMA